MELNHVKVTVPYGRAWDATIEIDGERCTNIAGVTFRATVDQAPYVILEVALPTFELNGEVCVTIADETARLLIAQGWTPPS